MLEALLDQESRHDDGEGENVNEEGALGDAVINGPYANCGYNDNAWNA